MIEITYSCAHDHALHGHGTGITPSCPTAEKHCARAKVEGNEQEV